jgi:hypothetical protein
MSVYLRNRVLEEGTDVSAGPQIVLVDALLDAIWLGVNGSFPRERSVIVRGLIDVRVETRDGVRESRSDVGPANESRVKKS